MGSLLKGELSDADTELHGGLEVLVLVPLSRHGSLAILLTLALPWLIVNEDRREENDEK